MSYDLDYIESVSSISARREFDEDEWHAIKIFFENLCDDSRIHMWSRMSAIGDRNGNFMKFADLVSYQMTKTFERKIGQNEYPKNQFVPNKDYRRFEKAIDE